MITPTQYDESVVLEAGQDPLAYTLYYVTKPEELPHLLEWLGQQKVVGLDLETSGLSPLEGAKIATLQLGNPNGPNPRAYVLDVRCFTDAELEPVYAVLRSRDVVKLGMNVGFECSFLYAEKGVHVRNVQDIQVAELIIRAGLLPIVKGKGEDGEDTRIAYGQTSMAALCKRYLKLNINKKDDETKAIRLSFYSTPAGQHSRKQVVYAALDTIYPFPVARKQRVERDLRKLKNVLEVEFATIPVLAESTINGMGIDQGAWRALYQEAVTELSKAQKALDDIFVVLGGQEELFPGR